MLFFHQGISRASSEPVINLKLVLHDSKKKSWPEKLIHSKSEGALVWNRCWDRYSEGQRDNKLNNKLTIIKRSAGGQKKDLRQSSNGWPWRNPHFNSKTALLLGAMLDDVLLQYSTVPERFKWKFFFNLVQPGMYFLVVIQHNMFFLAKLSY